MSSFLPVSLQTTIRILTRTGENPPVTGMTKGRGVLASRKAHNTPKSAPKLSPPPAKTGNMASQTEDANPELKEKKILMP